MTSIAVWKIQKGNDRLEKAAFTWEKESMDQVTRRLPQGNYTSFRTYRGIYELHLDDHFRRLADGARLMGCEIQIDVPIIRAALREIIHASESGDLRFRISIDLENQVGDVYLLVEPLTTPPDRAYQDGVNALLRPFQRENPKAKSTRFIENSADYRRLVSKEINEVLLFNAHGEILEGLSSNFFGFNQGELRTAEEGILPGITRSIVMDVAQKLGIDICLNPVKIEEIDHLDEAFITSASRGVLPVCHIEGTVIGEGHPGPVSRQLSEFFRARVEKELEEI